MKITKYEHACFSIEHNGKLVIVDPGGWTTDLPALESVVAVVVTHDHPDHLNTAALGAIIAHNPQAIIYAHESITKQLDDTLPSKAVAAGEKVMIEPFSLEFFGGEHAEIHKSYPKSTNLGVLINDAVYYPGDSFTLPNKNVRVLALPVAAPWLKISEAMDFCAAVKAELVFPTHDAVLSKNGKALPDRMIPAFAENYGGKYIRLHEPTEIDG